MGNHYKITKVEGNVVTIELYVTKFVDGKDAEVGGKAGKLYKDKADFRIKLVDKPQYLVDLKGNKVDPKAFDTIKINDLQIDHFVPKN